MFLTNNLLLVCSVCIFFFIVVSTAVLAIKSLFTLPHIFDMKQKLELGVNICDKYPASNAQCFRADILFFFRIYAVAIRRHW